MFGETLNVILLTFLYSSATLAEVVIAGNHGSSVAKALLADPAKLSESLFRTDPDTKVIDPGMPEEPSTQPIVEGNKPFGQDTVKPIQPEDVVKDNHPSQPILSGPDNVDQLFGDKQGTALENKEIDTIPKSDDKAAEAENPPTNPGAGPVMIEKPLDVKSTAENMPADIPERIETPSSERLEEENKVLIPLMPGPVMIEKPLDVKSTAENVPADIPERIETPSSERSEEENRTLIPLMPGPVMIEKPLDVKSTAENVPADIPERIETPSSEHLEEENKALIPLMPGPVMIEEPLGEQLPGDNEDEDWKGVNEDEGWKDDNEDEGWKDEDKEDEGEREDLEDKDNEDEGDWYDDADGWATGSTDGSATVTEKPDDFWEKFEDNDYYDDDDENSSGDSKGSEDFINAGQVLMESPHHFDSPLWALGGVKVFNGQVKEGVVPLFSDKREDLFSDDFQARQQSASMINVFSWMLLSLLFVIALAFFIHWNKRLVINYVAIWRGRKPRYGEENKNLLGHEYA